MTKTKRMLLTASVAASTYLTSAVPAFAQLGEIEVPEGFASNLGSIISGLLNLVMIIAAVLVFLYLIMGGIEWITSGGDKGKTESARNKITAAIIGLIILAASYAILQLALSLLGFEGGLGDVFNEENIQPITE
jgi:cytochrome bd-type quinol oxidase subunit 2